MLLRHSAAGSQADRLRFGNITGWDTLELSDLTAYAEEKFHIQEQHKWMYFPGFSVLAEPRSGKWMALLMRQWDFETGSEVQCCDLKCGRGVLYEQNAPYLSLPFRMRGPQWVGVRMNEQTDPTVVRRLLDKAVYAVEGRGYTVVLDQAPVASTVIPPRTVPSSGCPFTLGDASSPATALPKVPAKIREMLRLYQYGDGSFEQKCRNFYRQGKFMEDYEDDQPWDGNFLQYYPTYHDLSIPQLRGYFTWRTGVRKGTFSSAPDSFVYLYLYELLNGIGTSSPEDALQKMQAVETGFLDAGFGDEALRRNLHFWMFAHAVLHDLPASQARAFFPSAQLAQDDALTALRKPEEAGDEAVFAALCTLGGKKLERSPVLKQEGDRDPRLFAAVWRLAARQYSHDGKKLFTACFGSPHYFRWYPMSNAVYWAPHPHSDADYELDPCRSYRCRGGIWREKRYTSLYFNKPLLHSFLRGTDRLLRRILKTGHYLKDNDAEAWVAPYVAQVLAEERRAALAAARPKVQVRLAALDQIRQDASFTRDSLLTEADLDLQEPSIPAEPTTPLPVTQACTPAPAAGHAGPAPQPDPDTPDENVSGAALPYREILVQLLQGEPVDAELKARRLMPSVVADAINEALWEEVGDNVLECDGDTITLVEDYRAEVAQIVGGKETER